MIWIALTLCTVSFHALSAEENPSIEECQKRLDATGWTFASIQSQPEELEGFKVKSPKGPKVRLTSPSGTKMSYMEWKPSKRVETPDKGKLKAIEGVSGPIFERVTEAAKESLIKVELAAFSVEHVIIFEATHKKKSRQEIMEESVGVLTELLKQIASKN